MTNKEQYEISSVGMGQVCHAYPLPSGRFQEAVNLYGSGRTMREVLKKGILLSG